MEKKQKPKKGDILIALRNDSCGDGWYKEINTIKGKEYICQGTYECNGTCVYIYPEEGGLLGMGFDGYFEIKSERKLKIENLENEL